MVLSLRFGSGRIVGEGGDGVGNFVIRGSYDSRTGECQFNKGYLGRHSIRYHGVLVGHVIQGSWQTEGDWTGGFRIWPQGCVEGDGAIETEPEAKSLPVVSFAVYVGQDS